MCTDDSFVKETSMGFRADEHVRATGEQHLGNQRAYDQKTGQSGYVNSYGYFIADPAKKTGSSQANTTPTYYSGGGYTYPVPQEPQGSLFWDVVELGATVVEGAMAISAAKKEMKRKMKENDERREDEEYNKALNFYNNIKDYNSAFLIFDSLYKKGYARRNPVLYAYLAMCYSEGRGVRCDKKIAYALFREGYHAGDYTCTFAIGKFYYTGEYGEIDYAKAYELIDKAEKMGMNPEYTASWKEKIIQAINER